MIRKSSDLLETVEKLKGAKSGKAEVSIELWSNLGALRLDRWSELSREEKEEIERATHELEARFKTLLASRKEELVAGLESGIEQVLGNLERARKQIEYYLDKGEISKTLTSYELNANLLYWRDKLGYALDLAGDSDLGLPSSLAERVESLDSELRKVLPRAVQIYRASDDDPTPHPEHFPASFWWRHL